MKSIQSTFASRSQWVNKRASAIFPCYINENNDQVLTFQNYWKWKGKIKDLDIYVTLINSQSTKKIKKKIKLSSHNEISIKKIFGITKFSGMIHFEIFSEKNLRFPFPAIYCFFLNTSGLISCVHSGGRVLNKNELTITDKFNETNFLCKLNNDFEPFFHIFKGPKAQKNKKLIEIEVFNKNNKKIFNLKKFVELKKPYSSEIFFLSKFLNANHLKMIKGKEFFLVIKYSEKRIFGRIVAGNYDKKNDALFTTHTLNAYEKSNSKDIIKPVKNYNSNIFLSLMSDKKLNLETRVYPTGQKFKLNFQVKSSRKENNQVKKSNRIEKISSGKNGKIFTKKISNKNLTLLYANKKIPGRIYVSHNYSFDGCRHPTDMGLSFTNINIPQKRVHWGQLFVKKGSESVILIRNISHERITNNKYTECSLEFFNNEYLKRKKFKINVNSFKIINLKNFTHKIRSDFLSWKLFAKDGNLEVVWLSLNKKDGSICGDHSF